MAIHDLSNFVEFDEYLNRYVGQPAVLMRAQRRLSIKLGDIPYYERGLDERWLFKFGQIPLADVRKLLADIDPEVTLDQTLGRIVLAQAGLTIDSTIKGVQTMQTGVFT
jgi:hypothetical protein